MKLRNKIVGWKDVSAALIVGTVLGLCLWGITSIPLSFWVVSGNVFLVIGIFVGYALWGAALVGGTLSIIGLTVPTIHYVLKWIHWAFMYIFWADKEEPTFLPVWSLKGTWSSVWIVTPIVAICFAVVVIVGALGLGIIHIGVMGLMPIVVLLVMGLVFIMSASDL